MKKLGLISLFSLIFLFVFSSDLTAQWTQNGITHDGIDRDYWIYVPPSYDAENPVSIVVTLHGMGDDATNFRGIGFNNIADTANFIVLVPDAMVDGLTGMTAWNSRAGMEVFGLNYYPNTEIDDVGFIDAMINETIDNYAVNQAKIYACGFSMGGFMTQRLALRESSKFAAFASAAGTFGSGLTVSSPGRTIPIAHFHGTADATVGYDENIFGSNVEDLIDFWVDNNACTPTPIHTELPDTKEDGLTVDHYLYSNSENGAVVELFKVNNAEHIWLNQLTNDISYSIEMWKFFNRFEHQTLNIENEDIRQVSVYPNPSNSILNIDLENDKPVKVSIYDMNGQMMYKSHSQGLLKINVINFKAGLYFLQVGNHFQKIIIN